MTYNVFGGTLNLARSMSNFNTIGQCAAKVLTIQSVFTARISSTYISQIWGPIHQTSGGDGSITGAPKHIFRCCFNSKPLRWTTRS